MTSAQVVETLVNVISNSPSQDYTHPDDRTLLYDMTPGFKPFTILFYVCYHQQHDKGKHCICHTCKEKLLQNQAICLKHNAKLPTGTLRDYGIGVFFAIFPKS